MNELVKKILSWILVIIWLIIIFLLSAMDSKTSNEKSTKTIEMVVETTVNVTNEIGITNEINEEKINQISNNLNLPVRKIIHALVYFILILLVLNALRLSNFKGYKLYIIGFIICIIYSLFDEYHQTFVNGRTGNLIDVIIDTSGSVIGSGLYILISKFKKR